MKDPRTYRQAGKYLIPAVVESRRYDIEISFDEIISNAQVSSHSHLRLVCPRDQKLSFARGWILYRRSFVVVVSVVWGWAKSEFVILVNYFWMTKSRIVSWSFVAVWSYLCELSWSAFRVCSVSWLNCELWSSQSYEVPSLKVLAPFECGYSQIRVQQQQLYLYCQSSGTCTFPCAPKWIKFW